MTPRSPARRTRPAELPGVDPDERFVRVPVRNLKRAVQVLAWLYEVQQGYGLFEEEADRQVVADLIWRLDNTCRRAEQ